MRLGTMHACSRPFIITNNRLLPIVDPLPVSCLTVGLKFDTGKQTVPAVVMNSRGRKQAPACVLLVMCQVDGARLGTCMAVSSDTYTRSLVSAGLLTIELI